MNNFKTEIENQGFYQVGVMTQVSPSFNNDRGKNRKMASMKMNFVPLRETIHSGHFMVSDFEPESEVLDDEYEAGMPIPAEEESVIQATGDDMSGSIPLQSNASTGTMTQTLLQSTDLVTTTNGSSQNTSVLIDGSLTKLFQCMTLAYRQKLTSPKWNRFKGVRLRWKDKIRLNNVIWRCWHMQFILKQKTLVCQFASPLDVDQHNKPEAVVMEGKYWKRKLSTVAAEYKKWRLFYRNKIMGWTLKDPTPDLHPVSLDGFDWNRQVPFGSGPISNLIFDDDFLMDFSDTLFSSLSSNQFAFPNPRELARAGMVADFIQPGLIQLQPNLDDFMDTLEPLQDYVTSKLLPPVPEELDPLDPPDSLLPAEVLPSIPQKSVHNDHHTFEQKVLVCNNAQNSAMAATNYNGSLDRVPDYYGMHASSSTLSRSAAPGGSTNATSATQSLSRLSPQSPVVPSVKASTSALKRQHGTSRKEDSSTQNNIFAVPGPRGKGHSVQRRGRNNTAIRQALHATATSACPPSTSSMSHQMMVANSMSHGQMTGGVANSSTLLSHLLTTSGGGIDNIGGIQGQPHGNNALLGSSSGSNVNMMGSGLHMSKDTGAHAQQQSQPWNAKSAVGSLSPNVPEHRRVCHINAEQKRRCNIKNGFDMLHSLIPQLSHNPNAKVSKAAMLQKGAEYIRQLKQERGQLKEEIEAHRQEVEALNAAINNCQSMLPATGAPVSRQRTNKMKEMFDQWVRMRTLENWKFWIFSILIRPLLDSYNSAVSTASLDEMCRTVLAWVDQHCSLVDLRPAVLNSLRYLCTTTDILSAPANLPEEAYKAVNRSDQSERNDQR